LTGCNKLGCFSFKAGNRSSIPPSYYEWICLSYYKSMNFNHVSNSCGKLLMLAIYYWYKYEV
jgi:hypothetical protein